MVAVRERDKSVLVSYKYHITHRILQEYLILYKGQGLFHAPNNNIYFDPSLKPLIK